MKLTKSNIAEFICESNAIEGIHTPSYDILTILNGNHRNKPSPLIANQINAVEYVKKNKDKSPTVSDICELHGILLDGIDRFAGKLRPCEVWINSSAHGKVEFPKPGEVMALLYRWVQLWGRTPYKSWSKRQLCLTRHYEFECVHPFTDGNGRTGRLLLLWDCLHNKTNMDIISCEERYKYYEKIELYRHTQRDKLLQRWQKRG